MRLLNQAVEMVAVDRLRTHPRNANQGDVGAVHSSITANGFYGTIVAQRSTGYILAGNHRYLAALHAGATELPVCWVDVDDATALRILLADNRTTRLGHDDPAALAELLQEIIRDQGTLAGTGYDTDALDEVLEQAGLRPRSVQEARRKLAERFGAPPFSVWDRRQGYWQERKRYWDQLIQDDAQTREHVLSTSEMVSSINNGASVMDPVLVELALRFFCPPRGRVVDPCAGDTAGGIVAGTLGHPFTGIELRPEQAGLNNARAAALGLRGVHWHCDDGANLDRYAGPGTQDMLFSCPPYYDLERYSDDPADLSNAPTYDDFMHRLDGILRTGLRTLKPNRFAVLVVGDIRDERGAYRRFHCDVIAACCSEPGVELWNHIITLDPVGTLHMRWRRPVQQSRKLGKTHQDVLVLTNGDPAELHAEMAKVHDDVLVFYNGEPAAIRDEYGEVRELSDGAEWDDPAA